MSRLGAKCPECGYVNPRSLGSYYKGVDDIEEIEETYVCEECQIVFRRTGKVTWNRPRVTVRSQSSEVELIPVSENPITSRMYKDKLQSSRGKAK